ncbi:MAG: carbohydrate ABC transporter permease [Ruminococcus sp.]|nr:carbohydrate ABC transporter permease [Ruminococcus sp.]
MARLEGVAGERDDKTTLLIRRIIAYVVLIILVIISLFPFYLLIVNATRGKVQTGVEFVPSGNLASNFKVLMSSDTENLYGSILGSFGNSFLIGGLSTILSVYFSALTAYATYVYDFKLKKVAHTFILLVMMVPTQASAIGLYRLMISMNLVDTFIPLIVPAVAAPAVYFFMYQYLQSSLPLEIVEAARIDGCGEFRGFNTIVLPILKPALAVQAIFQFVASWNNLFMPMMILNSKKTIPMVLQYMKANINGNPQVAHTGMMSLYIVLAILPVIVVYLLLSKYIIRGISLGAVKG